MASQRYTIANMTRIELAFAIDWAADEGWNPGLYDADCFYQADPNGFFIGLLDSEPVASISVVKYNETFGFLGFYIVKPAFRGRGYGWQIWQAGLKYLAGCNIGLDGVLEQQENYLKSGFALAHRNIRFEGLGDGALSVEHLEASCPELVTLAAVPMPAVMAYDRQMFPAARPRFLKSWLTQPESHAVGFMQGQTLTGYGMVRPCRSGYKIGPLFADTPAIAEAIFLGLKRYVLEGNDFYLDVPEVNAAGVAMAERHQMRRVFETARMYTQQAPDLPLARIFGITTFELG